MSNKATTAVRYIKTGKPGPKTILFLLADAADNTELSFRIKAETLAKWSEMGESTVLKHLTYLSSIDVNGKKLAKGSDPKKALVYRKRRRRDDGTLGSYRYWLNPDILDIGTKARDDVIKMRELHALDDASYIDDLPLLKSSAGENDHRSNRRSTTAQNGVTTAQIGVSPPLKSSTLIASVLASKRTRAREAVKWTAWESRLVDLWLLLDGRLSDGLRMVLVEEALESEPTEDGLIRTVITDKILFDKLNGEFSQQVKRAKLVIEFLQAEGKAAA